MDIFLQTTGGSIALFAVGEYMDRNQQLRSAIYQAHLKVTKWQLTSVDSCRPPSRQSFQELCKSYCYFPHSGSYLLAGLASVMVM
jgi:hypothetical protein